MAVLALTSNSWTDQSMVVLASDTAVLQDSKIVSSTDEEETPRKPYRSIYGGRLKLVPTRKLVRVTTSTINSENMTPWRRNENTKSRDDQEKSTVVSTPQTPTFWQKVTPLIKRGVLLAALTAVAVIDKKSPAILPAGASIGKARASSWFPSVRLDWNKLWGLPGEILPSLSAALMIAWIPNLVLQKAYFELAFLFVSLTSQATLRSYLVTEVLPSLGGTLRKLFWSEFWKQAWDYLLDPFPHNLLLPSTKSPSQPVEYDSQWQAEVSKFWSNRVVSRIDKWTASSVKALLQKNVQASVNGLAEDTWKAAAYAWYPDERNRRFQQLEDTRRMIEIECEGDDKNCQDVDEATEASIAEDDSYGHDQGTGVAATYDGVPVQEQSQESSTNDDTESNQELPPSSRVEVQEVPSHTREIEIEEPEAVLL